MNIPAPDALTDVARTWAQFHPIIDLDPVIYNLLILRFCEKRPVKKHDFECYLCPIL